MARVCVEVPAKLVARVGETVLLLYGATAESLHLALRPRAGPRAEPGELARHRARLAELDELLGALGWPDAPAGQPVSVSAPRELLHDALYGTLIDAGERLAAISERCWRGELPPARLREAAEEVLAVDALLRELDGAR